MTFKLALSIGYQKVSSQNPTNSGGNQLKQMEKDTFCYHRPTVGATNFTAHLAL